MGVRLHSVPTFKVEYGSTISNELTDQVINVFYDAETGWVSEDETIGEIAPDELLAIIGKIEDEELKKALQLLYDERDKDNNFVRFEIF